MWSLGCVLAEMQLGLPIFPGESSIHQLVVISKILGTPEEEVMKEWNFGNSLNLQLPSLKKLDFEKHVFVKNKPGRKFIEFL